MFIQRVDKKNNSQVNFVLVHLGKKPLPAYTWDCIDQLRAFNTNPIYLIINIYNIGVNLKKILDNKVTIIYAETLKKSPLHKKYRKNTSNKWFWRFTTERFFYVGELMQKKGLKDVIHLENDNLIYCHVDNYLEQFRQLNDDNVIGVTRDSNHRCIGGVVYVPSGESLNGYLEYVSENPQLNDMKSLSDYLSDKNCSYLPVIYPEYEEQQKLVNQCGEGLDEKYEIGSKAKEFGLIFDAAALGQYIGGIDKIHNPGDTRGFVNETACYHPGKMNCKWVIEDGRRVPVIDGEDYCYKVFNLHIHCKELSKYMSLRDDMF